MSSRSHQIIKDSRHQVLNEQCRVSSSASPLLELFGSKNLEISHQTTKEHVRGAKVIGHPIWTPPGRLVSFPGRGGDVLVADARRCFDASPGISDTS